MSNEQRLKTLLAEHTALRRAWEQRETQRRIKLLQAKLEKGLLCRPFSSDVPLHQRGFGVMDEE